MILQNLGAWDCGNVNFIIRFGEACGMRFPANAGQMSHDLNGKGSYEDLPNLPQLQGFRSHCLDLGICQDSR